MAKVMKTQQQRGQRDLDVFDVKLQMRMLCLALEGAVRAGLAKGSASALATAAFRIETKLGDLLPLEA